MCWVSDFCHQLRGRHSNVTSTQANNDSSSNEHAQVLCTALDSRTENDQEGTESDGFLAAKNLIELGREGCRHENTDINGIHKSTEIRACLLGGMLVRSQAEITS